MDLQTAINIPWKRLLRLALERGGSYADLFFEQTIYHDITLRDGQVNTAGTHTDSGLGIRVLTGDQTGYAFTESVAARDMERAAHTAAFIADSSNPAPQSVRLHTIKTKNLYPVTDQWNDISPERKIPFLQEMNDLVFGADKRVKKVIARLSDTTTFIRFYDSEGTGFTDLRPMASLSVSCIMEAGGKTETASCSRSFRMGGEFLQHSLIEELAAEVVARTAFQFSAVQPKGGEMPVVMAAGGSGILLHEAIGHAFEADFIRKSISIFSGRLGTRVCAPGINIIDDGTIPFNRGSINIDDEGTPGQKTYMVTDGILTSFLHDRISAVQFGVPATGNGRRESFRFMPLPRMRATYMENGPSTEESLIASIKKGLYVDTFSNGQVQIGAGDFTFYVKSGYLIEKGKLTRPVKDVNIIGNGPAALADIKGVANNFIMDNGTWTCGKEQSCPVSCGMPTVLVGSLTVGGRA